MSPVNPSLLLRKAIQDDIHARGIDASQGDTMERMTSLCLAWYRRGLRDHFERPANTTFEQQVAIAAEAEPAAPGATEWWPK